MPSLDKMGTLYGESVLHLYIKNLIKSHSLYDLKRPGLRGQCGGYQPDVGNSGCECH
jgi:hypothetical protein